MRFNQPDVLGDITVNSGPILGLDPHRLASCGAGGQRSVIPRGPTSLCIERGIWWLLSFRLWAEAATGMARTEKAPSVKSRKCRCMKFLLRIFPGCQPCKENDGPICQTRPAGRVLARSLIQGCYPDHCPMVRRRGLRSATTLPSASEVQEKSSLVRVFDRVISRSADAEPLKFIAIFSLLGLPRLLVIAIVPGVDFGAILSQVLEEAPSDCRRPEELLIFSVRYISRVSTKTATRGVEGSAG
jgi:hypothetical protein